MCRSDRPSKHLVQVKRFKINLLLLTFPLLSECNGESPGWNMHGVLIQSLDDTAVKGNSPVRPMAHGNIVKRDIFIRLELGQRVTIRVWHDRYFFVEPLQVGDLWDIWHD